MADVLAIIAQASQAAPQQPASPFGSMLIPLVMMGFIFYFLLIRPQSKEKKRRAEMLHTIKKNDRVVTIGGILGTVVTVKDEEVTLKVDESTNTKITLLRSAIQRVTSSETPAAGAEQQK